MRRLLLILFLVAVIMISGCVNNLGDNSAVDEHLITENLKALSSLPNRFMGTAENKAAGEAIESALLGYGYSETRINKTNPYLMHQELENGIPVYIAAVIPGKTPNGKIIVLSAHFDSAYSGADDNASGVAALLEMARILRDAHPADTIYIVFTNGEEYGKIGAEVFSEQLLMQGITAQNVIVMNIDSIGQSYEKTVGQKPQIVIALAENTNTSLLIFGDLYGVEHGEFGLWEDSTKFVPGGSKSDANVYAQHGFSTFTVTGSSAYAAKEADILNTEKDEFTAIEPKAVAGITDWLLKVIVRNQNLSEIVRNTRASRLSIKIDRASIVDFSPQMTSDFQKYGINFTSNRDFVLSENGYYELKGWMKFVSQRLPQYKKYLTTIRYKRNFQGPTVVATSYTASKSFDITFPVEDYPVYASFIKSQYHNETYFTFPEVWTHELSHLILEKELDGVPDVRVHTKMMTLGYTEDTFPYDKSLKELVSTDLAYYLLYGKVFSKGHFPINGFDVDLKATAPARQKFIEDLAKKIGVRDMTLAEPDTSRLPFCCYSSKPKIKPKTVYTPVHTFPLPSVNWVETI